mgnify:CR=1 FL=1
MKNSINIIKNKIFIINIMVFSFLKTAGIFPFSSGLNGGSRLSKNKRNKRNKRTIQKKKGKIIRKKTISRKNKVNNHLNRKRIIHKSRKKIYTQKKRNNCNCDVTKYYKGNEPSPKGLGFCANCTPLNITMKGLDGNLWKNKLYQNSKRWVKVRIDLN